MELGMVIIISHPTKYQLYPKQYGMLTVFINNTNHIGNIDMTKSFILPNIIFLQLVVIIHSHPHTAHVETKCLLGQESDDFLFLFIACVRTDAVSLEM